MIKVIIDRNVPETFGSSASAIEFAREFLDSGDLFAIVRIIDEEHKETQYLRPLSKEMEGILNDASTLDGYGMSMKASDDLLRVILKLEIQEFIYEITSKGEFVVYHLTEKGLMFWNDYKAYEKLRRQKSSKKPIEALFS